MSNLRSTGQMPLKTSMSNKWKSQAPSSDMLERQTRALEESLNKLKLAMHPDKTKASSESANAPIWDKGKQGPMSQYATHLLRDEPRKVFDPSKPTKVRVLGDEPPATVTRPSLVASLFNSKPLPTTAKSVIKCGQCEKAEAKMKCLECAESYCASCFAHFHLRGALQRHRCVPLTESRPNTPQKKKPAVGADVIFKELRFAQSKDDLFRKSTTTNNAFDYQDQNNEFDEGDEDDDYYEEENQGGELLHGRYDEKSSAAGFQQALMQWRQSGNPNQKNSNQVKKSKRTTHEAQIDTVYDSNGRINQIPMPKIEFHSSKLTYAEKLLVKKYRRTNKFNQETSNGTTPTPKPVVNLKTTNLEIEPLYDELPTDRTQASERTIIDENEPRTKSRLTSRPNSAAKKKTSRPPSAAAFQHPLPSLLSTIANEELKAIVDHQSRPNSAALKKPGRIDSRLPTMWNRNWKPDQSISNEIDPKSIRIDQDALNQFDAVLDDLLDENKIEADQSAIPPRNTPTPTTGGRRSLFTFAADSARQSLDMGDGGFFTDVNPKKSTFTPRLAEAPAPVRTSIPIDQLRHQQQSQIDDQSRAPSSLSSASLPVSIISSQPEHITRPSIERHPKLSNVASTSKRFRVEYPKKSSAPPPPVVPMVIEGKKVTSARDREDPQLQSSRSKISSGALRTSHPTGGLLKTSSTSSMTSITRDENMLRDESLTLTDGFPPQKSVTRRSTTHSGREPTKARKIEFTIKDGTKWHQGSTESKSSKILSASHLQRSSRPATPSNPVNTKIGNQFSNYDKDDGRSSRACQDVEDEQSYNQLHEELSSQLSRVSPDWDASLSEHVLKNLRTTDVPFNERDIQENLNMLEIKLRESELVQRSQTDDDISVHEEIRNL